MAFGAPRQMFQVDVACSKCGTHIAELPFQPTPGRKIFCKTCNDDYRKSSQGGGMSMSNAPRQMYQGNWSCSSCSAGISQLPFQPKDEANLLCRDCLQKKRDSQM